MNKPLTVEELKNLEVGDWIWVIYHIGSEVYGEYRLIKEITDNIIQFDNAGFCDIYLFADYDDKKWIAYKNKEQAENN